MESMVFAIIPPPIPRGKSHQEAYFCTSVFKFQCWRETRFTCDWRGSMRQKYALFFIDLIGLVGGIWDAKTGV
jgi:hypothetical protein